MVNGATLEKQRTTPQTGQKSYLLLVFIASDRQNVCAITQTLFLDCFPRKHVRGVSGELFTDCGLASI